MMKYSRKYRLTAAFVAAAAVLAALVACGSSVSHQETTAASYAAGDAAPAIAYDDNLAVYDTAEISEAMEEAGIDPEMDTTARSYSEADSGGEIYPEEDRKIIMNAWVTIEALEYEQAGEALERVIEANGGYVSSSGIYNSAIGSRSADYTVRVPAENYRALLQQLEETGNMVSRSESSEDVTTQYIDIEARLKSLRAQEERLLELMAEAGDLESLILVQQQLSETQYQIEYYEGLQKSYDRQIAYSTVQIHLYEVVEYTEPEPENYVSRLGRAFTDGWKNALLALQSLSLAIVGGLPVLIVLAVLAVVLVLGLRRARKRSTAKLEALRTEQVPIKPVPAPEDTPKTPEKADRKE